MMSHGLRKRLKRLTAIWIVIALVMGIMPMPFQGASFAVPVGDDIDVTDIRFVREHDGFNTVGAYVEIAGSGLEGKVVRFEKAGLGGGFEDIGRRVIDEDTFIKFTFEPEEAEVLTGAIRIGTTEIDLGLETYPNLSGIDQQNINLSTYGQTPVNPDAVLKITGNNLDKIGTNGATTILAKYGRVQARAIDASESYVDFAPDYSYVTLTEPPLPGEKGFQNIIIEKTDTSAGYRASVEYLYANAFRFMEDLGLQDPVMFPNTGAKGDHVYFTAPNFVDTKNYDAYFLKTLDGSDQFKDENKAEFVALELGENPEDEDRLIVEVPDHASFELRSYYVVLTNTVNDEIIAEQVIRDAEGNYDQFTVIGAGFKPTIESIFPKKGPDTGANVQISGRNILTLNLPDLEANGNFAQVAAPAVNPSGLDSNKTLRIIYDNDGMTYKGKPASTYRDIKVQIGKEVFFVENQDGSFNVSKGLPDSMLLLTDTIDDAVADPFKDVVIEITTTITEDGGASYTFSQIVSLENGYEFEPSTLTPVVDEITPDTIQIEDFAIDVGSGPEPFNKFAEDTLIAIKGDQFLVDKEVDEDGNAFVRYPTVLIKKNNDNTFVTKYQLGFFPNEEADGVRGIIKYKTDENEIDEYVLRDEDGDPVPLQITVVDSANNIVDGTEGNDVGNKILIKIPNIALLEDGGIKHIQVTNPRRQSDEYGASTIKSDSVSFVKTTDVPVIESVDPQITTVEGDVEIVITGANFQDGVRVFLDGEEIEGVTKEIATDGEKILLTFVAPPGRAGTTQLQVINPNGGLAVKDFTYVTTFAQDPIITDFNPKKGTEDTLVVIDGDNYLRPDPTAAGTDGYDGFRLIGTRVFVDGKDVNSYVYDSLGNIDFEPYTAPGNEIAIRSEAGKALYSPFIENTYVIRASDGKVFSLGRDKDKNPRITGGEDEWYDIRRNAGDNGYEAYDASGILIGDADIDYDNAAVTTVDISGGPAFEIVMNNSVLLTKKDPAGVDVAAMSDYAESIILTDGVSYYTMTENFEGDIRLSNGKENIWTIIWDVDAKKFVAKKDSGGTQDVTIAPDGKSITVGLTDTLTFLTAYVVDPDNNRIVGDRTDVVSKFQVAIRMPALTTGKGYKDIRVVNPDTKYAQKTGTQGFYYVTQPSSSPVITQVKPNKGATEGGYVIDIHGYDFQEGMKVFIDSVEVPQEDVFITIKGDMATVRVPRYKQDLIETFGVDEIDVSVVVLNQDGGSDALPEGFKYIIPVSSPEISQILPGSGSATGGDIVEILGFEFRFFEPYENKFGGTEYNPGDDFEDLHPNGTWDDLLDINDQTDADGDGLADIVEKVPDSQTPYFDHYLWSEVLPTVYFGEEKAKIVEFSPGYMKVITPKRDAGTVKVTVVNNDLGVSNEVSYTYSASGPTVERVSPDKGRKQGMEIKDIYGKDFYRSTIYGYADDIDDAIVEIEDIDALIRFGDVDNLDIPRELPNSGLIFNRKTTVALDGGLKLSYNGYADTLTMTIEESGKIYTRVFNAYDDSEVYLPAEMLKGGDKWYTPNGYPEGDGSVYSGKVFEYVRVYIEDKRMLVERGYAPKVEYDNVTHLIVTTPSYHTIDPVDITITNPDGGWVKTGFTYTNPDSNPKIYSVGPKKTSPDETYWMVEGAVNGNIEIEIMGTDFRQNALVRVGNKLASVQERTSKAIDGIIYDVLIVTVPNGTDTDVGQKYPVMVENEDGGLANSATLDNLIGPNHGAKTLPFYFIYRKPLSGPVIESVLPAETSVYGGHEVVITGKDFRAGAIVIIGTVGGIPITDTSVENQGTVIRFTTPKNMIVGDKAVIVQNPDFGQDVLEGGIRIVSYPEIDEILNEAGDESPGRLSVEGGEKLMIKGSGFQPGAVVILDGVRNEYTDESQSGDIGLWRDDKRYIIENGTHASGVEFVDSKTLIITTPQLNKEADLTVTILNPDTGISDGDATVEYSQPVPADPTGLKVEIVDDHFIKLYDYESEAVEYYEIYYYIGSKAIHKLKNDGYEDFSYLDTTVLEPYKITKLPGFEKAGKGDKIHFVLRAVNAFGMSNYSNIAFLTFDEFEDVEYIGEPDVDGGLEVPAGQDYRHARDGGDSLIDLAGEDLPAKLVIDLRAEGLRETDARVITVPAPAIQGSGTVVYVNYGDLKLQFIPVNLNTAVFREMNFYFTTYGRIVAKWEDGDYASLLKGEIPRGQRAASLVFNIAYYAVNNDSERALQSLSGQMDIVIPYDMNRLRGSDEGTIKLYRYDTAARTWVIHPSEVNVQTKEVHARIGQAGYYILMADR